MAKYRIEAQVSIDDGPWEAYRSTREATDPSPPTPRQAAWLAKDHVALVQTGHDLSRVKIRNVRLTDLEQ